MNQPCLFLRNRKVERTPILPSQVKTTQSRSDDIGGITVNRLFVLLVLLVTGPGVALHSTGTSADAETHLTIQQLKNAEYRSELYGNKWVKLRGGTYEERTEPDGVLELMIRLSDKIAFGDLNNDGLQDAAVVLMSSGGGSGSFRELVVVLNSNGGPRQAASQPLGDRTDVKAISIKSGVIYVDLIRHGPNDPLCCPTIREVKKYKLDRGNLVAIP
jgi:hypothetical protein